MVRVRNGRTPVTPLFRRFVLQQEVLVRIRLRGQRDRRWRSKLNAAADKLLEGTGFHHTANQPKVQVIAGGESEHRVITYQMLIFLTDSQGDLHAIRHITQRGAGHGTDFDAPEQDRRS